MQSEKKYRHTHRNRIRFSMDFLSEIMQARGKQTDTFKKAKQTNKQQQKTKHKKENQPTKN